MRRVRNGVKCVTTVHTVIFQLNFQFHTRCYVWFDLNDETLLPTVGHGGPEHTNWYGHWIELAFSCIKHNKFKLKKNVVGSVRLINYFGWKELSQSVGRANGAPSPPIQHVTYYYYFSFYFIFPLRSSSLFASIRPGARTAATLVVSQAICLGKSAGGSKSI